LQSNAEVAAGGGTRLAANWIQFTKRHSQNANFVDLFRIHQSAVLNNSFLPRMLSSNSTNMVPAPVDSSNYWFNTTNNSTAMTHGLSAVEFQFFISQHWVIWSTIDGQGRGGTAGIYEVESTGQDVWARSINSLYSPQIFISAAGSVWPSTTQLRVTDSAASSFETAMYGNLMYNGDSTFTNRGQVGLGQLSQSRGTVMPQLYPDINTSFFPTRDQIGDTQNYMIPVYFHTSHTNSTTVPAARATLNGRIPFLWRTTDNAAQTGQKATVSGTEYRFVRLHSCGTTGTTGVNAATYMVPTLIGGI
jgi:hypothetical protein